MRKALLIAGLLAGLAQQAAAWRPPGWCYFDWPWVYELEAREWHWFYPEDQQWVYGFPPAAGWGLLGEGELAGDWSFFQWPFVHDAGSAAWFYVNESDWQSCVNMRTGEWSWFGDPSVFDVWPAGRSAAALPLPEAEVQAPGVLILPPLGSAAGSVPPARIRANGIDWMQGNTRWLRFSDPALVTYQWDGMYAPGVPQSYTLQLPGEATTDLDIAIVAKGRWAPGTTVDVVCEVRDPSNTVVAARSVHLIGPLVAAIGDSMTFGVRRRRDGTMETPNWSNPWLSYPSPSDWNGYYGDWDDIAFQGMRGYLARDLAAEVVWAGHPANGHGPDHCGYSGSRTSHINSTLNDTGRAYPRNAFLVHSTYIIVLYWIGLNDTSTSSSASEIFSRWRTGIDQILQLRAGLGRTLIVGITLPRIRSDYAGYSDSRQAKQDDVNDRIRGYSLDAPQAAYIVADIEGVPHDSNDDGLHYMATGYSRVAAIVRQAVVNGLARVP